MIGLFDSRRLVVKVGSSLLIGADGRADESSAAELADDLATVRARGGQVVLVSSGAVALGRAPLGLDRAATLSIEEKQAAAAAGQARLMGVWSAGFARYHVPVAQVLLTWDDTERRRRWLNARETMATLLRLGAVPVVNENDTVATEELRYGDNDRLAARVAQMTGADHLLLLSDVDGLYTADPRRDPDARHIARVEALTPDILAMAGGPDPAAQMGTGGMASKLAAAAIAGEAGCATVIAAGRTESGGPLSALAAGARSTVIAARRTPRAARKAWIASSLDGGGALVVDDGAANALRKGRSLLPAGVTAVRGVFGKGDTVRVLDGADREVARGLARRDSAEAARIAGLGSDAISASGLDGRPELVHADDLVLAERPPKT